MLRLYSTDIFTNYTKRLLYNLTLMEKHNLQGSGIQIQLASSYQGITEGSNLFLYQTLHGHASLLFFYNEDNNWI